MIPSNRWFPTTLAARGAWYANFATQFERIAVSLGFTAADITEVNNDNDVMQFVGQADTEVEAYEKAVRAYRKTVTEGDVGDATPDFPANPAFALPVVVPTGIFERLDKLV